MKPSLISMLQAMNMYLIFRLKSHHSRRDGSPFVNLLLIAPLYDNKGVVRYFIGAQVDVNGLIEGGHGLESFERLLAQDRGNARFGGSALNSPQQALSKLSSYWNQDEISTITKHAHMSSGRSGMNTPTLGSSTGRRVLGMGGPDNRNLWPELHLGPSGRLPGVFQNVCSLLIFILKRAAENSLVSACSSCPIPPHNIHIPGTPHPRPSPSQVLRLYCRTLHCPSRSTRGTKRRRRRDCQSFVAESFTFRVTSLRHRIQ